MNRHRVVGSHLDLVDYRRHVAEFYTSWRAAGPGREGWLAWRQERDRLLAAHPQSAIVQSGIRDFTGMPFFDHDPTWRLDGRWEPLPPQSWGDFSLIGRLLFRHDETDLALDAYWLDAYGGGLFVPFGDETNGDSTYAGGRYLLDTAKGADLGVHGESVVLDFNGAYHPSCVFDDRWECPLTPPANRLPVRVEAGERLL